MKNCPMVSFKSSTRTVTRETYKINHRFDCMEKCLIYLLTCNNQLSNS